MFQGRTEGSNTPEKMEFARSAEDGERLRGASLKDAVAAVQPTALIGAAAAQKPFTREVLQALVSAAEGALRRRRAARFAGAVQPLRRRRMHCPRSASVIMYDARVMCCTMIARETKS